MKIKLFILSFLIVSLIGNLSAVSSQQEGIVHVKLTFIDGFTGKPVDGSVWTGFWKADELWKENMFQGELVEDYLKEVKTVNGKFSAELPLHGAYYIWFWPKEEIENTRYGWLPAYEPRYATFVFDGETNVRYTVITYPIGFIIADLYSPTGEKIEFKEWDDVWNYNLARFHGVSSDDSIIIFYTGFTDKGHHFMIAVPAGKKSKIVWTAHVPGYGWAWLKADNRGEYYILGKGGVTRINLVLETAWTMYRKAIERAEVFKQMGYRLNDNATQLLNKAQSILEEADSLSAGKAAKLAWEALRYVLLAEEQAILDKSLQDLEHYRMGRFEAIVPDGYHVNITLDYVDFFFSAHYAMEGVGTEYWLKLEKMFKYDDVFVSAYDAHPDGFVPEYVIKGSINWLRRETNGLIKRVVINGHPIGPGVYVDTFMVGEGRFYPPFLRKILKPTNETAMIEFSKNRMRSIASAAKHIEDVEVVEYIMEDELEFTNHYCWKTWNGKLLVTPCPLDYKIRWMKEVSEAIKKADPNAKVFISTIGVPANPTLNHMREWLGSERYKLFTSPDAIEYFLENGVKLDGFNIQIHMNCIWDGVWDVITLYDVLEDYGRLGLPIGLLEFYVPSRQSEDKVFRPWRDGFSEENQAELLRRSLIVLLGNPQVIGIVYYTHWYDTKLAAWAPEVKSPYYPVGLIRANGTPKPAYYALLNFFKSRIYQGEIQLSDGRGSVKTLEGWYYVTVSDKDGNVVGSYRIHVDGGSKTYLIFHQYENQTLRAEVKRLREEMEKSRARISGLEDEIKRLEQDVHEKGALIAKLREQCSEEITRTTITTTLTETTTLQTSAESTLETYLLMICIATLVIAITLAIASRRR